MPHDSPCEFRYCYHPGFDVGVTVQETGYQIAIIGRDHEGVLVDGMGAIGTNISDAFASDGHINASDDFTRLHAHPTALADDHVGRLPPHHHVDQALCDLAPTEWICVMFYVSGEGL
jgi:hypothetical protein